MYTELRSGITSTNTIAAGKTVAQNLNALAQAIGKATANGTYITTTDSVTGNLTKLDTQVKANTDAIAARTTADTELSNKIGALDANLSTLDTQVKSNADAIQTNTSNISANKTAIDDLKTSTTTNLATKADVNASNLTSLSDTKLTAWGTALGKGTIAAGSKQLVTGDTIYNELKPTGKVYYIDGATTTAARLTTLDNTLKTFADQLGVDLSNNTNLANQLYKYFKVNPKVTTDTTTTYEPDAAANGTKSVAIGPSAQAGEKTTDATTSATTVTGGTSSTAIGDSAKANGDQSVALGYNSQVLNASGSTTAVSGSTAIGNGAKVEGGSDSTALGTNAAVDTASNAMALGTSATINKTATSGVAIGNGAVTGSADTTKTVDNVTYNVKAAGGEDSVAIGTSASNAGNTSIAIGKGAAIENDTDGSYQAVVKSDDIAIGTGAKTSASDSSTAIGKSATVSQSTDALAVGNGAQVSTSNNAMAFGKGANAGSAADSIAMGTSAKTISADTIAIGQSTSAEGANSVVIGKNAKTTTEGGNAIGYSSAASGRSTAIGQSATANNYNAVAIGNNATANADRSISLGYNAGVGTREGKGETQNAGSLIAIGTSSGNNVSGMQNVAIGENAGSNVKSSFNVAIGSQAGYGINYASDDKSQNGFNVSIGYKANYQENSANIMFSTALGNEANASNYAVAIGDKAKASGTYSLALGDAVQASDTESIALGHNTNAADGNVAIGNGSLAPAVSSLGTVQDGYVYKSTTTTDSSGTSTTTLTELKSAFTYKPLASDSHYISVGNSNLTRRISNVADGVFDSDAATVGQLNSLNELLQATDTKVGLTKDYFEQKFTDLNTTIDSSKTHYFSISESSDNLSGNKDNTGATSNKADAMAIGPNANATNVKSLAVGNNVYATGLRSIAIGTAPNPTTDAAGTTTTHNTSAEGENSIALGTSTTAQADNSVAIGTRAQTYTTDTKSGKTGARSVAIGNLATTAGDESVALGYSATVKYNYGTAIGKEALASGVDAVAIGKGSKAYGTDSMAIGQDNTVIGSNVYGLGSSNSFSGEWGSIIQSGVSGYKNTITSVSDQDTTNALTGIYMTGNSNTLNQNVKYNVMQDITVQGSSNTIDGGAGGTSSHQNTLSQIAIVGSGNTVQGKSSDDGKTNNIKDVTILGYNNKVDANTDTTVDFSNTQILGSNVTAALGNSVYLGNHAAYVQPNGPAQDAIDTARTEADTAAEASDEYKAAVTDEDKATIKAQYEAKYLYKLRVQAMEAKGTTAGMNSYNTDETYGNGTSYTYAGSNPAGVVTVGKAGEERRIQNVAAGLVSASSTDAVNGSQLYALTRQLRFGGDNSSFGTTTADDKNVVARGSNETLNIIGGEKDATKLTDNNIGVMADSTNNSLSVKLASDLKKLNTASLGSGSGDSYKETIKLDGTNGKVTVADSSGTVKITLDTTGLTIAGGPKFTSSGIDAASQKITSVKAGEADTDAANVGQVNAAAAAATTEVKAGTNASLGTVETNVDSVEDDTTSADGHHIYKVNVSNLGVKVADGQKKSVALSDGLVFGNGTNTTASVGNNGAITFNVSNEAIKTQAKDAINMTAGSNVKVETATSTDGLSKTFTISATHNTLKSATLTKGANDVSTLTITGNDGDSASVDIKNTHLTVTKDSKAKTVTFTSNDGNTPETTLSLSDFGAASTADMNAAKAAASTEIKAGTNASLGTVETNQTDQHKIYTVNVDNLGLKQNGTAAGTVTLANGINFADGTNTSATVSDGKVTFDLKKDITGIDTVTASNSIQAGNIKVGKQGTDNENYVTGLDNKDWTVGQTTYEAGRAATEDQLKAVSDKVASGFQVTDGTTSANIGADKKVTFTNGNYTTAKVTQATDGASIKYDINTAQIKVGSDGKITELTTDGVVTAQNVAQAINNAAWNIKANDGATTAIKAGTTVGLKAGNNLTLSQSDTDFTYTLNDTLTGIKSLATVAQDGVTTTLTAGGVTIASSGTANKSVSLTANGLNNGGKQITDVASGGDTDTNAANISDVKRLVQASANGTTETGFNVKGDDATAKKVKLGKQLNVVGGTNDASKLSDNNIGVVTTADAEGNATLTVKLNKDINLDSVKTGNTTLNTNGVSNGDMSLTNTGLVIKNNDASKQVSVTTSGVSMGSQRIQNVVDATSDTDAATLGQVKSARTKVAAGSNVASVGSSEDKATHQMTYTVNVDNLSVKVNTEAAKSVTLKNGLTFNNGTNTTASVGDDGEIKYDLNSTLAGLTSVTAGNSTLNTNGLTIKDGAATKVEITSGNVTMGGNVIHNVGAGQVGTDAVNKDQLDALQTQVNGGWNLAGNNAEGTAVTAKIGAGKTVTYDNGNYTKAVVTKDDSNNATVKVDVTTGTFGSGTGDKAGTVTATVNGLATTQDVANAINSASISVVDDNTPENKTAVKAGGTIHFNKDDNLTLTQDGAKFTYGLNREINISKVTTSDETKGSTVQTAEGITTKDAAGNTYEQTANGITLTPKTPGTDKTAVSLTNTGLNNGGNKITGVGKGTEGTDAVNLFQLEEVQKQVGSGWQLAGNDGQKVADIGAGKKVAFKTDSQYLTAKTEAAGTDAANVTYGLKTKALTVADGKVSSVETAEDGLATAKNVADTINQTYWTAASGKSGSGSQTDETVNAADKQISAGKAVTFNAGNNLSLVQNGASFTYGLQTDLTGMNTITFTPRSDTDGRSISLVIGKQKDGVSTDEGYYITGLDNTTWNQSNYVSNRAATEAQLASAIKQVTLASQSGGFKLSDDNNKEVSQVLGKAIGVVGDGNITTTAETTTTDTNGHIKVSLNKNIDLETDGSVTIGSSSITNGQAKIGSVTVNGTDNTVSGLSNTKWEEAKAALDVSAGGYKGSTRAATESQLAEAVSKATSTAAQNEQHIKDGTYNVGAVTTDKNGNNIGKNSVVMNIVSGEGNNEQVKGQVIIKDVAKASEVGDVGAIAKDIQNKNGDATKTTSVVEAINNLNDKVGDKNYTKVEGKEIADGDSATTAIGKLNNRMNDIYTSSTQHSSVSKADDNLTISESNNASGGTDYKIGLNKDQINLGNLTIKGNEGSIEAKSIKSDSFTAGDTVVNKDGIKVGDKSALTGDSLKVNGKTYVDDKGVNANGQVIRNVGDGKDDGDVVNVKQVNDLAARQGEAIGQNAAHINQLDRAVNRLDSRINRVGAGAAALAALHPGNYDPDDKVDFAAGFGNYRGASAAAVGMYYHPDETTTMSVGASFGGGENMVNAGITWKMGKDSGHMRTQAATKAVPVQFVAAPTQTTQSTGQTEGTKTPQPVTAVTTTASGQQVPIVAAYLPSVDNSTRAENDELKELLARQTAILEKLAEQKAAAAPAAAAAPVSGEDLFPDVPENHWAYDFVAKLAKAGALKDCRVEDPANNPMLTRNDFAQILYTALKNGATKNPALNKDNGLNRLASEFRAELKNVKR